MMEVLITECAERGGEGVMVFHWANWVDSERKRGSPAARRK